MSYPQELRDELRRAAASLSSVYQDPSHYDLLAQMTAPADLPFYRTLCDEHRGPILELGCGTGRLTLELASDGREITGVELVESMIEHAVHKARERDLEVTWALGDLRSYALERTFAVLLLPYNTFNHLLTHDDVQRALTTAREHMNETSRLVIDTFQPSLKFLGSDPTEARPILRYLDPYLDKEVRLFEENHYDPAAQLNRVVWRYEVGGVADARVDELTMRMFFPQELDSHLRHAGLHIEHKWGDYDRRPFDGGSSKQLVVCRRA